MTLNNKKSRKSSKGAPRAAAKSTEETPVAVRQFKNGYFEEATNLDGVGRELVPFFDMHGQSCLDGNDDNASTASSSSSSFSSCSNVPSPVLSAALDDIALLKAGFKEAKKTTVVADAPSLPMGGLLTPGLLKSSAPAPPLRKAHTIQNILLQKSAATASPVAKVSDPVPTKHAPAANQPYLPHAYRDLSKVAARPTPTQQQQQSPAPAPATAPRPAAPVESAPLLPHAYRNVGKLAPFKPAAKPVLQANDPVMTTPSRKAVPDTAAAPRAGKFAGSAALASSPAPNNLPLPSFHRNAKMGFASPDHGNAPPSHHANDLASRDLRSLLKISA